MWLIWNEVGYMCAIYGAVAYLYYKKERLLLQKREAVPKWNSLSLMKYVETT